MPSAFDERYDEVDDIVRARRVPSPQLVGTPQRSTLDLNALTERGELVGRPSAFTIARRSSPGRCTIIARWRISSWTIGREDRPVGRTERKESRDRSARAVCADPR
jgi:hypothetical protein